MTYRVAAVQMDVAIGDPQTNWAALAERLATAAANGARLIVAPECVLTGYCFDHRDEAIEAAIPPSAPWWPAIIDACRRADAFLVLGYLATDDEGHALHNASSLIGPDGIVATYHKVHLPGLGVDRFVDRGTDGYAVHDAGDARVGLAICYDCSFPEPMRVLGLAGADIVALSTNWPVAASRTAVVVPPARSMENHYYFVAANRIGHERGFKFGGLSSICGPDGVVLASTDRDNDVSLYADMDLSLARNKTIRRSSHPDDVDAHVIDRDGDRRPEHYGRLTDPPQ